MNTEEDRQVFESGTDVIGTIIYDGTPTVVATDSEEAFE